MKDNIRVSVTIPRHIWEAAKVAAAGVGQSAGNFMVMATAQRLRNWTDAITGESPVKRAAEMGLLKSRIGGIDLSEWSCWHSACNGPAESCKKPEAHQQQGSWKHVRTFETWEDHHAEG